ncbi:MAG: hypothetical protein EOM20_17285 [Spartobacteria bacterium]|nr:hypothetical protein [Spartobacteria bacterium]
MNSPVDNSLYAAPRHIADTTDCYFYHTLDIPGVGTIPGDWDLRDNPEDYLGGIDFRGKRVLELGTASGFLCFHMEQAGAEVVGYDLGDDHSWDVVPFDCMDPDDLAHRKSDLVRQLKNGYWYAHEQMGSAARVVYGSVYAIPAGIGPVDIATFGSILLHLRDPFLAMYNALRLAKETAIVTDLAPDDYAFSAQPMGQPLSPTLFTNPPALRFRPDPQTNPNPHAWWELSPEIVCRFLRVLGFEPAQVRFHRQKFKGELRNLFTVVGHRNRKDY